MAWVFKNRKIEKLFQKILSGTLRPTDLFQSGIYTLSLDLKIFNIYFKLFLRHVNLKSGNALKKAKQNLAKHIRWSFLQK